MTTATTSATIATEYYHHHLHYQSFKRHHGNYCPAMTNQGIVGVGVCHHLHFY